jgi:ribosomal protein L33
MLIYSSNINIFSINCVQFNILFEFDIFVLSRLFDMSNTFYYKTLRINVRENRNNPEKLAILDTQDTRRRQTIQRNWQHWIHKTQDEGKQSRETGNIGYTRHKTKVNNPEKLATLDTQDTRRMQTIQRNWQHWVHKTQDEGKQSRETGNIGYTRHKTKANNPEKLATLGTQDTR